ncbi:hypothetical protein B0H67DRAFT_611965 [Lasiosphaeris hirsuta]|uniref:Uncharacterized protein n=1 Tax=Lasiosphaeris hirsuta TaxID=260670 RepID=A0AA40AA56_9PEZI|nr:hypothetical protein B0H67DRAFT_611965 [Lasiosphaeris hirsuta]
MRASTILAAFVAGASASVTPMAFPGAQSGLAARQDTTDAIRITEVLESLYLETGPLAWQNVTGGQLLTIPTDVYEKHEIQALAKRDLVPRYAAPGHGDLTHALATRDSRGAVVGGTNGRKAEWICYSSGTWAYDSIVTLGVSSACFAFNLGIGSGVTQIYRAATQKSEVNNQPGPDMNVYLKYTGYGILFLATAECNAILTHLINGYCQGSYKDFHGGFFDVYENSASSGSYGRKAYSLHADPQNEQCKC